MTEDLKLLIEAARSATMTPADREAQRRSFAYGNTHFENARITRGMIDQQAEKMSREQQGN